MDLTPLAQKIAGKTSEPATGTPGLRLGVSAGHDAADRDGTIRVTIDGTEIPGVTTLCGVVPAGLPVWCLITGGMVLVLGSPNQLDQAGTTVFSAAAGTITFPRAYSTPPIVVACLGDSTGAHVNPLVGSITTTGFAVTGDGWTSGLWRVNWVAYGWAA